ncbi:MAG: PAS domain-containing protein [Alphaproteobacteria bacterium]|nr:PAS domain-containing protein [Alphaproteobacteria bacterium]
MSTTTVPEELSLAPRTVVAAFLGPALLFDDQSRILAANAAVAPLVDHVRAGMAATLGELVRGAVTGSVPAKGEFDIERDSRSIVLDLVVLPLSHRGRSYAIVLMRESTLERNFIDALVSSRQLFKDLVSCSANFAWETNRDGKFTFVSGRGAMGYPARELFGRSAATMRVAPPDGGESGPLPFDSRVPLEDVEVWLVDRSGEPACLLTSCIPVFDEQRQWVGARGVCHDVTEARKKDAALKRIRDHEQLAGEIVTSIRTEVEPPKILGAAVRSTATILRATFS